jgi:hypothetical protein
LSVVPKMRMRTSSVQVYFGTVSLKIATKKVHALHQELIII